MSKQAKNTAADENNQDLNERERIQRLQKKAIAESLKILGIFGLPAIAGVLVGQLIDNLLNIAPFGSLAILMLMFVTSWIVVLRTTLDIRRVSREAENDSENQDAE